MARKKTTKKDGSDDNEQGGEDESQQDGVKAMTKAQKRKAVAKAKKEAAKVKAKAKGEVKKEAAKARKEAAKEKKQFAKKQRAAKKERSHWRRQRDPVMGDAVVMCFGWLGAKELSQIGMAGKQMHPADSDMLWKPLAVQRFPELAFRREDGDWRNCFMWKIQEPEISVDVIEQALMASGENLWKCQDKWFACSCGHLFLVGECGRVMQVATCPDCHKEIGGRNHNENEATTKLNMEEAKACLSAGKHNTGDIEVHLRRISGQFHAFLLPGDCTTKEAKWRVSREIGIPALQLSLVSGDRPLWEQSVLSELKGDSGIVELMLVVSSSPPPRCQEGAR